MISWLLGDDMPFMNQLVSFLLRNRMSIIKWFWIMIASGFGLLLATYFVTGLNLYWSELGKKAADIAVIFFLLSLMPGIMKRYQVGKTLSQIQLILMTFRRQFGIGMFTFAFYHYCWSRGFNLIKTGATLIPSQVYEIVGMTAFLLTLPLFLSSNNFSIKKMGMWWKITHRLVYLINWLVFAHVALLGNTETVTIGLFLTAIAEAVSWILLKSRGEVEV